MSSSEIKDLFDRAYNSLRASDIASAAATFQQVILRFSKTDPLSAKLADQRIRWYCIPLDAIFQKMEDSGSPVEIGEVIAELIVGDKSYDPSEANQLVGTLNAELAHYSYCQRLGETCWILCSNFENHMDQLVEDIHRATQPLSLRTWLKDRWPSLVAAHSTFPDHYTLSAVIGELEQQHIRVVGNELALSPEFVKSLPNRLAKLIKAAGRPVELRTLLTDLSPSIQPASPTFEPFMIFLRSLLMDQSFVEILPGQFYLLSLLNFISDSFEDLFPAPALPLSTLHLVGSRLSIDTNQIKKISSDFQKRSVEQLLNNPALLPLRNGYWLPRSVAQKLSTQALSFLETSDTPLTTSAIIAEGFNNPSKDNARLAAQADFLNGEFRKNAIVLALERSTWLHLSALSRALDSAYESLLRSKQQLLVSVIVQAVFGYVEVQPSSILVKEFENHLLSDPRFTYTIRGKNRYWYTPDPAQRDNDLAFRLLTHYHCPLTLAEIISIIQRDKAIDSPAVDLASDNRFKSWMDYRWGLAVWVCLNDWAYEYLLQLGQALHANVITGLFCMQHHISEENAIFLPDEDPRFVQDNLNRWFSRRLLTDDEVERLYTSLQNYAGIGTTLDNLVIKVIRVHPNATDASARLASDPRFIILDDRWFARESAYYELTETDVEIIYNFLAARPLEAPEMHIKDLVKDAIGRDGRLTNAADWLSLDDRFKEVHPEFWTLSAAPVPDFGRVATPGVAIHPSSVDDPSPEGSSTSIPANLTHRQRRPRPESITTVDQKKVYFTLDFIDIHSGNIRISGTLKAWIPAGAETVSFWDDYDNAYVAYIDETGSILNLSAWLKFRGLTYGDKISIQPGSAPGSLYIRPYGNRDKRVYDEALSHQDIQKLIDKARQVGKPYHDLMIEVMESLAIPLHREDIFQLVDYQRTAARATIFETLSLTDCPYEELRYFVPQGRGYWSFSRERKEAYDMKMNELVDANANLRGQIAMLTEDLEIKSALILSLQNRPDGSGSKEKIERLASQVHSLQNQIAEIQASKEQIEQVYAGLENEYKELLDVADSEFNDEKLALQDEIHRLETVKTDADNLNQQHAASILILQSQLSSANHELEMAHLTTRSLESEKSELVNQVQDLGSQLTQMQTQLDDLQSQYDHLHHKYENTVEISKAGIEIISTERDQYRGELQHLQQLYQDQEKKLHEQIQTAETLAANLDTQTVELTTLQQRYLDSQAAVSDLTTLLESKSSDLVKAREENRQLAVEHSLQLEQLQSQFQSLESDRTRLRIDLDDTRTSTSATITSLQLNLQKVEEERAYLHSKLEVAQQWKADLDQANRIIVDLQHTMAEQQKQLAAFTGNLKQQLQQLQDQSGQSAVIIADLTEQLQDHQHRLAAQSAQLTALQHQLKLYRKALYTPLGRLVASLYGVKLPEKRE